MGKISELAACTQALSLLSFLEVIKILLSCSMLIKKKERILYIFFPTNAIVMQIENFLKYYIRGGILIMIDKVSIT